MRSAGCWFNRQRVDSAASALRWGVVRSSQQPCSSQCTSCPVKSYPGCRPPACQVRVVCSMLAARALVHCQQTQPLKCPLLFLTLPQALAACLAVCHAASVGTCCSAAAASACSNRLQCSCHVACVRAACVAIINTATSSSYTSSRVTVSTLPYSAAAAATTTQAALCAAPAFSAWQLVHAGDTNMHPRRTHFALLSNRALTKGGQHRQQQQQQRKQHPHNFLARRRGGWGVSHSTPSRLMVVA